MKNLEVQIDQIATVIQSQQKEKFSSDMKVNIRKHCNAITLKNGKIVEERKPREVGVPTSDPILAGEKQTEEQKTEQRYLKKEFDEKFSKFLEVFKKIHINIPFAEDLAKMPNYAKFLKEAMSKKRKLEEFETVKQTKEALCDLEASINLMPLSVFKKLGLGEVKPTTLILQLADRSIRYPKGIIEDVLVKVDKFIFLMDFVVLDMEKDEKVPLILGRPFFATGRALIDVQEGKLTLRINEEQVTFNIH
ncbi:uncharacterized protein LOC111386430 [Olea europaea var. sylvestris]|uniref:uncharacterized protein LOC111386430 n=1 Tax=Olea europaea var. sylvestris TaxID=158386 RepID=UPI000C1CD701|nr:uncharacterized protein LOC111386430 [Olea europaea var. sylvestris]